MYIRMRVYEGILFIKNISMQKKFFKKCQCYDMIYNVNCKSNIIQNRCMCFIFYVHDKMKYHSFIKYQ